MTFSADAVSLPDVNVWIAAASDRHEHHATARQWFDSASAPICFCRVTQMAFLRLLTTGRLWARICRARPRRSRSTVNSLPMNVCASSRNPWNIENAWVSLMSMSVASGSTWTDAYLAAFAREADFRSVSFDRGMRRWPGLALELLMPAQPGRLDY